MTESEFDEYAQSYSDHVTKALPLGFGEVDRYARIKVDRLAREIRDVFPNRHDLSILDAGCGVGITDGYLKEHYLDITGFDVSAKCLEVAAKRNPELCYFHSADGILPFPDSRFDVVFAICVVHHVPPLLWASFFAEIYRVLRPGGLIAIFEHNPWNPLTQRVVAKCEFDRDATLLTAAECKRLAASAGFNKTRARYILFLPSEARRWGSLERAFLSRIPLGAQYCMTARK